jgi:hypothetical protein
MSIEYYTYYVPRNTTPLCHLVTQTPRYMGNNNHDIRAWLSLITGDLIVSIANNKQDNLTTQHHGTHWTKILWRGSGKKLQVIRSSNGLRVITRYKLSSAYLPSIWSIAPPLTVLWTWLVSESKRCLWKSNAMSSARTDTE